MSDTGWDLQRAYDEGYKDGKRDAASPWHRVEEELPKRGEWIKHEDDACECSVCGLGLESFVEGIFYNFCPFCGADMRVKMEAQDGANRGF